MLQGLVASARQLFDDLRRSWLLPAMQEPAHSPASLCPAPLRQLVLTDGVGRTLFEQYADHRAGPRHTEETGWLLLGLREAKQAIALAALPAGLRAEAGVHHVRFNSTAQVVGSRIVRHIDRRLTVLGVVHTHPGSLRHPSEGDRRGDRAWVGQLRGREGVFGIGTADVPRGAEYWAQHPRANVQCLGDLRFSWYSLREGQAAYRPLPVTVTLGPDLAVPLHRAWPTLERHADRIERLARQQAGLQIDVLEDATSPGLMLTLPLAGEGPTLRIKLSGAEVGYFVDHSGELVSVDPGEARVDRGVYLLLAELATAR